MWCFEKSAEGLKGVWWLAAEVCLENSAEVVSNKSVDFLVGSDVTVGRADRAGSGSGGGLEGGLA